jgi:hypothetical protein
MAPFHSLGPLYVLYEYVANERVRTMIEARKILRLLVVTGLLFIYGCEGNDCPDTASRPSPESLEEAVVANCLILQAAVEEFAAQNVYGFPVHILEDTTDTGLTAIDLLPGGERLVNPFTGRRTEPVDRRAASQGEVGYEEFVCGSVCSGYTITGCGWDSVIVVLTNLDALEDSVIVNCLLVQQAAEEWAGLSCGIYPVTLSDPEVLSGNSLVDLLPDGRHLMNPFTGVRGEPVDGYACLVGQTGYIVVLSGAENIGYMITGVGRDPGENLIVLTNVGSPEEGHVRRNCFYVWWMANAFASRNNGVFSRDIDVDTNLDGDTLLDLLMDYTRGELLENPYSHEHDQPVDRRASNPGETGYEAVQDGAACIVTGVGAEADSVIVEYDSREMSCY